MAFVADPDNIIPLMTSNTTPSGVAMAGKEYTPAYKAFNHSNTTHPDDAWIPNDAPPEDLLYDFGAGNPKAVIRYKLTGANSNPASGSPTAFTFNGSQDNSAWTTLDSQAGLSWTQDETKTFNIATPGSYRYYMLWVTACVGGGWVVVGELEMFTSPPPTITSFTPVAGYVGTTVTITGTGFSATASDNTVKFNGTAAVVVSSTTTSIVTTVPGGATTGTISVETIYGTAVSTDTFTVYGFLYRVDAMESLIRATLNESSTVMLTDAMLLCAINDGYKDVAAKAFCVENEDAVTTVSGDRTAAFAGHRINEARYGSVGLLKINPPGVGHIPIYGTTPQYWYQWGNRVVIEPVPDAAYPLTLFVADYPAAELTLTTEYPTSLPDEFHPCIVDFACYVLSMRLKKWGQVSKFYNLYINNLKKRRKEYMDRKAEKRAIHSIPENVKYEGGAKWAH